MEDYNHKKNPQTKPKKKPTQNPATHTYLMCPTWKELKKTLSAKSVPLYTFIFQLEVVQEKEKPFRTGMNTKEKK